MIAHIFVRLLLASLFVGFILSVLDVSATAFWLNMFHSISDFVQWIARKAGSLAGYVATGALVVIPVWLVLRASDYMRARKGARPHRA